MPQAGTGYRPLGGVKVLDLARLIPGDLATLKLADLGADVIKIEDRDTGDPVRLIPPIVDGVSVHHWNLNRGKRSMALDLKSPDDRALFDRLSDVADVIVEVSVPGKFERLGIDFAAMRVARPELVVCSISGFGQSGPYSSLPSHGMNMDALAGNVIIAERGGRPAIDYRLSTSLSTELGAANAALAVTAAVLAARAGMGGAWIDSSCWDAGLELHRSGLVKASAGHAGPTEPNLSEAVLYAPYRCADHRLFIFCAIEQRFWWLFCDMVGRPDLRERWQGAEGGVDYRIGDEWLREEMDAIFLTADSGTWFERFLEKRIPGCVLRDEQDLIVDPHAGARAMIVPADAVRGPFPVIANPVAFLPNRERPGQDARPSPKLDEDREAILRDWLGGT